MPSLQLIQATSSDNWLQKKKNLLQRRAKIRQLDTTFFVLLCWHAPPQRRDMVGL